MVDEFDEFLEGGGDRSGIIEFVEEMCDIYEAMKKRNVPEQFIYTVVVTLIQSST